VSAQRDGRPAEYRWRPLFNAAKFGWRPVLECSNAAKTRNPLKFAGVPQTRQFRSQPLVGRSSLSILWGHVEDILPFNNFFPIIDMCLTCEDTAWQNCAMVPRWRVFDDFLRPVSLGLFYVSRMLYISDLHSKFALRPHHMWKSDRHSVCDRWD